MVALLDANVLYPAPVRDILLHLADANLFQPKWSDQIQQEWTRNLLINRPDLNQQSLDRTITAMNRAFPDANVTRYSSLIQELTLPDEDDRHILAAAIKGKATQIITANMKHFPAKYLKEHNIIPVHPDAFVSDLIITNKESALEAFEKMISKLKNPPRSPEEVMQSLDKCELKKSVELLKNN